MDALELIEKLAQTQIVQSEISLEMQLGLPYLEKRNENLFIRFFPHKEEYEEGDILIYPRQYEIAWVYPFEHLAFFRNLAFERAFDAAVPVQTISERRMLAVGKYGMNELYLECSKALDMMERDGTVSDAMLRRYQKRFSELVETLGLEALYGELTERG